MLYQLLTAEARWMIPCVLFTLGLGVSPATPQPVNRNREKLVDELRAKAAGHIPETEFEVLREFKANETTRMMAKKFEASKRDEPDKESQQIQALILACLQRGCWDVVEYTVASKTVLRFHNIAQGEQQELLDIPSEESEQPHMSLGDLQDLEKAATEVAGIMIDAVAERVADVIRQLAKGNLEKWRQDKTAFSFPITVEEMVRFQALEFAGLWKINRYILSREDYFWNEDASAAEWHAWQTASERFEESLTEEELRLFKTSRLTSQNDLKKRMEILNKADVFYEKELTGRSSPEIFEVNRRLALMVLEFWTRTNDMNSTEFCASLIGLFNACWKRQDHKLALVDLGDSI